MTVFLRPCVTPPLRVLLVAVAALLAACQAPRAVSPAVGDAWQASRQLVLVTTDYWDADHGVLRRYERVAGGAWHAVGAPQPLVPTDAIVAEGVDTRVIVVLDDGQFRPVRVRTGRSADGQTEILAGLQGGERIVTSGQFLLDSEASLSGALERLGADPGANSGTLEPRSTREAGGGEGPGQPQASGYLLTRKGTPLRSPKGEGKEPAMPGMTMPMPTATAAPAHDHESQP